MIPSLILTDLDGTLLDEEKHLSPQNRAALERAAEAGAQVVVSTGRFMGGLPQELLELPFLRYFILMNGAKVYDRETEKVLYQAEIEMETAQQVFSLITPYHCTVDCYQGDEGLMSRTYYDHLEDYIPHKESRKLVRKTRTPLDDFRTTVAKRGPSVQKIQCFFPDLSVRPVVMEKLAQAFPQLVQSISMPANLEINAPTATKGHALTALCQVLGIDVAHSIAFGDGTNDITMLQTAGIGVAMKNARPEVQQVADLIAPSNVEHGVAAVLERWFPK